MAKEKITLLDRWRQLVRTSVPVFDGGPRLDLQGNRRLVIESHRGMVEYSDTCMQVAVRGGRVRVTGAGLELLVMNREELVIGGTVAAVELLL